MINADIIAVGIYRSRNKGAVVGKGGATAEVGKRVNFRQQLGAHRTDAGGRNLVIRKRNSGLRIYSRAARQIRQVSTPHRGGRDGILLQRRTLMAVSLVIHEKECFVFSRIQ